MTFLFFLISDLQFLSPAVFGKIFNATVELIIPTATPNKEPNAKIETQPATDSRNKGQKIFEVIQKLTHFFIFFNH